jgi:AraC-like DNA-binding protein
MNTNNLPVRFERLTVPAPLARWVQFIWVLQFDDDWPIVHRVIPAGAADLVFAASGLVGDANTGQRYLEGPGVLVSGPCGGLLSLRSVGPVMLIGARLVTGRAFNLLGVPLCELAGRCLPFHLLCESPLEKSQVRVLSQRLGEIATAGETLVHAQRLLLSLAASARATEGPVQSALSIIRSTHGKIRLEALASTLGVTCRQLEREFQKQVGLCPKVVCRLERFHYLRARLGVIEQFDWSHLACECGYYDQAHLINEVRHFTGQTPLAYSAGHDVGFFQYGPKQGP